MMGQVSKAANTSGGRLANSSDKSDMVLKCGWQIQEIENKPGRSSYNASAAAGVNGRLSRSWEPNSDCYTQFQAPKYNNNPTNRQ